MTGVSVYNDVMPQFKFTSSTSDSSDKSIDWLISGPLSRLLQLTQGQDYISHHASVNINMTPVTHSSLLDFWNSHTPGLFNLSISLTMHLNHLLSDCDSVWIRILTLYIHGEEKSISEQISLFQIMIKPNHLYLFPWFLKRTACLCSITQPEPISVFCIIHAMRKHGSWSYAMMFFGCSLTSSLDSRQASYQTKGRRDNEDFKAGTRSHEYEYGCSDVFGFAIQVHVLLHSINIMVKNIV